MRSVTKDCQEGRWAALVPAAAFAIGTRTVFRLKVLQAKGIESIRRLSFGDFAVANAQMKGRHANGIKH